MRQNIERSISILTRCIEKYGIFQFSFEIWNSPKDRNLVTSGWNNIVSSDTFELENYTTKGLGGVVEGGNENSLGQIPRETSDYWTSNRTVRHTESGGPVDFLESRGRTRYNWITNEFIGNGN